MGFSGLRAIVSGCLCAALVGQPLWAAGPPVAGRETPGGIPKDERVLHALNRLTFGPRPGDVARVQAMGLDAWFERQLNPGTIDDSALEGRLGEFPAMRMSEAELETRYPGPQAVRRMAQGQMEMPSDPALRAVYADHVAFYQMQQAKKAAKGDDPKVMAGDPAMAGNAAMAAEKPVAGAEMAPMATVAEHAEGVFPRARAEGIIGEAPEQRVRTLMAMPAEELARFRQSLTGRELAALVEGLRPEDKEMLMALPGSLRMIAAEEMQTRMLRDVYSERQLEAVMTDFWLNHFNVYVKKSQVEAYEIPAYERETIRPHALGRFEDLLVATAESPAMMTYLDNWRSIGPESQAAARVKRMQQMRPDGKIAKAVSAGLNENYGRELMELHTLGVGGGYTQADVTQVAKVFTGWTVDRPYQGGGGCV